MEQTAMLRLAILLQLVAAASAADGVTVSVDWSTVSARTKAIATIHNPNSYGFQRTNPSTGQPNPLHDVLYSNIKALGATRIRYMLAEDTNGLNNISRYECLSRSLGPSPSRSRTRAFSLSLCRSLSSTPRSLLQLPGGLPAQQCNQDH
jgi:hypothetical protein